MGLLPSTSARASGRQVRAGRPAVERIAGWSALHRKTAVLLWLAFVVGCFIAGQFVSSTGVQQYDPGQAGQGEQVLTQLGVVSPPAESVLIEARTGARHIEADAARRVLAVAGQVERALTALPRAAADIRAPFGPGGHGLLSHSGLAALVTFNVAGPGAAADATVLADLAAVHRIQAQNPGLLISEAGDASTDRVEIGRAHV